MAKLTLNAHPRTVTGRKVSQLRAAGMVPVVVYGDVANPLNLQVGTRSLEAVLHHGGFSQLVEVSVEGGGLHNILIREVQRHPVSKDYLHADFYAVSMTEKQEVEVPLVANGRPTAMLTGLMIYQAMDTVRISALPADIPASIEFDITNLTTEEPVTVGMLPAVPGVEFIGDPNEIVISMIATREETIEEPVEDAAAEPEVLAKGKQDEEE
jgi:large subunit ribosomal protein L25